MRTIVFLILIVTALIFYSCQNDNVNSQFPYEAEVIGESLDCGDFEIKIIKGGQEVSSIIGVNFGDFYTAKNLPEDLKIEGLKIRLNIRKINTNELLPCTTLGIPYPWLFVTEADKF